MSTMYRNLQPFNCYLLYASYDTEISTPEAEGLGRQVDRNNFNLVSYLNMLKLCEVLLKTKQYISMIIIMMYIKIKKSFLKNLVSDQVAMKVWIQPKWRQRVNRLGMLT